MNLVMLVVRIIVKTIVVLVTTALYLARIVINLLLDLFTKAKDEYPGFVAQVKENATTSAHEGAKAGPDIARSIDSRVRTTLHLAARDPEVDEVLQATS